MKLFELEYVDSFDELKKSYLITNRITECDLIGKDIFKIELIDSDFKINIPKIKSSLEPNFCETEISIIIGYLTDALPSGAIDYEDLPY